MALSEREQRMLDEMEQQLFQNGSSSAEASELPGRGLTIGSKRRVGIAVLAVVAGLALLVFSVSVQLIWLGVIAFVIMLAGAVFGMTGSGGDSGGDRIRPGATPPTDGVVGRFEERWERRRQEDHG